MKTITKNDKLVRVTFHSGRGGDITVSRRRNADGQWEPATVKWPASKVCATAVGAFSDTIQLATQLASDLDSARDPLKFDLEGWFKNPDVPWNS